MRDNEINIKWIYTINYLHYMFSKGHTQSRLHIKNKWFVQCADSYLGHLYCHYIILLLMLKLIGPKGQIDSIRFMPRPSLQGDNSIF